MYLQGFTIPGTVSTIGKYAFSQCLSLDSITVPVSASVGENAFNGCSGVKTLTVPMIMNTVKYRDHPLFAGCISIETVYFTGSGAGFNYNADPNSDMYYQNTPWYLSRDSLTQIAIGDDITSVGDYTFCGCGKISRLYLSDSITYVGNSAFSGCSSFTYINVPDSVTAIGSEAFKGCNSATEIEIGDGVVYIGAYAFSGCTSALELTISANASVIGDGAFSGCTTLFAGTVPDSVRVIGSEAFKGCTSITTLDLGSGIAYIGNSAFGGCTGMKDMSFGMDISAVFAYNSFDGIKFYSGENTMLDPTSANLAGATFSGTAQKMIMTVSPNSDQGNDVDDHSSVAVIGIATALFIVLLIGLVVIGRSVKGRA